MSSVYFVLCRSPLLSSLTTPSLPNHLPNVSSHQTQSQSNQSVNPNSTFAKTLTTLQTPNQQQLTQQQMPTLSNLNIPNANQPFLTNPSSLPVNLTNHPTVTLAAPENVLAELGNVLAGTQSVLNHVIHQQLNRVEERKDSEFQDDSMNVDKRERWSPDEKRWIIELRCSKEFHDIIESHDVVKTGQIQAWLWLQRELNAKSGLTHEIKAIKNCYEALKRYYDRYVTAKAEGRTEKFAYAELFEECYRKFPPLIRPPQTPATSTAKKAKLDRTISQRV